MEGQNYSNQQVSVVLLNSALSFEYYMNETYFIYKDVGGILPKWVSTLNEVTDWSIQECFQLGLNSNAPEDWGDELLFQDFKLIADTVAEKNEVIGGKLAFLALFLSLILETYLNIPAASGKEKAHHLLSQLEEYLWARWQTDLDGEIINPDLSNLHVPMAQEFAERWQKRVESLSKNAS